MLLGQAKKFTATTASIPAPIGGWNARDSLAQMSPTDAVQLINFYPTPTDVSLRNGYTVISTGITGKVNSLMNYNLATGTYKLFAAAGSKIYDAKQNPAVEVFSGITSDKFVHVAITNTSGNYLIACNGADPTLIYDGTRWFKVATTTTAQTISSITRGGTGNLTATLVTAAPHGLISGNRVTISGATPAQFNGTYVITVTNSTTFTYTMATAPSGNATVVGLYTVLGITGVDSSRFANVNLFKNRLYFTEKDSLTCWYLPVDSIGGAASPLYFGGIARNGGYLQAMGTWTLDAGQGADDYAVFVTSMGEIIVYNGTDPDNADTWVLKGVWQLGQTFARKCFFKWSGDLLLLTQDGLVPLASALQSSRLDPRVNLTDKIYYAVSQAATIYYANFGWQINYFASENMLILNVPITNGIEQYVMHTITKSWARFTNIEAYCWEVSGDADMHFGGDGYVATFYTALSDDGSNIKAFAQQAYSYFDSPGQQKRFTLVRPILQSDGGTPSFLCGISVDFDTNTDLGAISFNPNTASVGKWDAAIWDSAAWNWGSGTLITTKQWQGVTGIGFSASMAIQVASQGIDLRWASTDYVMEKGGVL
jgi:hypothetical protein